MEQEFVYCEGGECKTLGGNRIGEYLVLFGSPSMTDQTEYRDYFTSETDFDLVGCGYKSRVLYEHGLNDSVGTLRIGQAHLFQDSRGIGIEARLDETNRYSEAILAMVADGLVGWSSGTVKHLIRREQEVHEGRTIHKIVSWPLGLDASLTLRPADKRLLAALKSGELGEREILERYLRQAHYFGMRTGTTTKQLKVQSMSEEPRTDSGSMKKNEWSPETLHDRIKSGDFMVVDAWKRGMPYWAQRAQLVAQVRGLGFTNMVSLSSDSPAALMIGLQGGGTVVYGGGTEVLRELGADSLAVVLSHLRGVSDGETLNWLDSSFAIGGSNLGSMKTVEPLPWPPLNDPRLPGVVRAMIDDWMGSSCLVGYWDCSDPERPGVWLGLCLKDDCWPCCGGSPTGNPSGSKRILKDPNAREAAGVWLDREVNKVVSAYDKRLRKAGHTVDRGLLKEYLLSSNPNNAVHHGAAKFEGVGVSGGGYEESKEVNCEDLWNPAFGPFPKYLKRLVTKQYEARKIEKGDVVELWDYLEGKEAKWIRNPFYDRDFVDGALLVEALDRMTPKPINILKGTMTKKFDEASGEMGFDEAVKLFMLIFLCLRAEYMRELRDKKTAKKSCGCGCSGGKEKAVEDEEYYVPMSGYIPQPTRDTDKPFLMPVEDVFGVSYWDEEDESEWENMVSNFNY